MFGFNSEKKRKVEAMKDNNRPLLEAVLAAAVLVAFADGKFERAERKKLRGLVETHPALKVFGKEVGKTLEDYTDMYEAGERMAKAKLMGQIADLQEAPQEVREDVILVAAELAEAKGNMSREEFKMLSDIAATLDLNAEQYI